MAAFCPHRPIMCGIGRANEVAEPNGAVVVDSRSREGSLRSVVEVFRQLNRPREVEDLVRHPSASPILRDRPSTIASERSAGGGGERKEERRGIE